MAKFSYITSKTSKQSIDLDEKTYAEIIDRKSVEQLCDTARSLHGTDAEGYSQAKSGLPLALWLGYDPKHRRQAEFQKPTQYFYIDIDHATRSAKEILFEIQKTIIDNDPDRFNGQSLDFQLHESGIRLVHETPSGGFRMLCKATAQFTSVEEHLTYVAKMYHLNDFGDVDMVVKDFARGSFIVKRAWHLYIDPALWTEEAEEIIMKTSVNGSVADNSEVDTSSNEAPVVTDEMRNYEFNGVKVTKIAEEYIDTHGGMPIKGQRHIFYNNLVKNFRNICDNDTKILFAVLPLCEGNPNDRWRQVKSICKQNSTTLIPKDFYFWLKARGYIEAKKEEPIKHYLESPKEDFLPPAPAMPPVFREFCSICPPDFVYPTVVALLPVMGTLCSYLKADYMDTTEQTTTFFSCIYAPPSSNKSFVARIVDMLMGKIVVRDEINSIREQLYLIERNTLGDNKTKPDIPHVKVRIMPAIFSMPEFLEKMRDNNGYHMFTFAEEVDTFRKGTKAGGGGDKSDMFRCAWDNSIYGQSFKSNQTFKGKVKLYYNILLTGTPGAVRNYYSNVEDGMVTRVSICEIRNQKFAPFEQWKKLSKRQLEVIDKFVERCDKLSYEKPLENTIDDAYTYYTNSKEYDKNIKWRYTYLNRKSIELSWIFPALQKWLESKRLEASMSLDDAKDVFRRRAALKGFRLAMLCTQCWANVSKREQKVITDFVLWFIECDLKESLRLFGEKYNKMASEASTENVRSHPSLFEALPDVFTKNDIVKKCMTLNIMTKVEDIIWRWSKDKAITKTEVKHQYKKVRHV